MNKRRDILDKLDRITNAAAIAISGSGSPLCLSRDACFVGNFAVKKNKNDLYDITTIGGLSLYSDISSFDIAVMIAQRYRSGEKSSVNKILSIEKLHAKYYLDAVHYRRCLKLAKANKELERVYILEDKIQNASAMLKNIRQQLEVFKVV